MESCARRLQFCYGHRLKGHQSKCATLHGHNAIVHVHATPVSGLDNLGMVIDFSMLKEKVGGWIEENWDHTMILFKEDEETIDLVKQAPGRKPVFILDSNPTAENLADHLLRKVCPEVLRDSGVIVHKIVFSETPNCSAEQTLDPNSRETLRLYGLED